MSEDTLQEAARQQTIKFLKGIEGMSQDKAEEEANRLIALATDMGAFDNSTDNSTLEAKIQLLLAVLAADSNEEQAGETT